MLIIPDRNLGLELVRVTEGAALAAARWMGRGEKEKADGAAVDAMRALLDALEIEGVIVIGEGEKDHAPMLYNGEHVGMLARSERSRWAAGEHVHSPQFDIAVDPIDGTRLLANGLPNALSVIVAAERDTMFFPGPIVYMEKLAVGPDARKVIDLDAPVGVNLDAIARAKGKDVRDLTVVVLDRPRHQELIAQVRATGARLKLIMDGDVAASIATAQESSGIDALMGIGGSPEAVISAGALKCMGGEIHARLWARDEAERQRGLAFGLDFARIFSTADLVRSESVSFAATGITDGELLEGVHFSSDSATTDSLAMRSHTGTLRRIVARHRLGKVNRVTG